MSEEQKLEIDSIIEKAIIRSRPKYDWLFRGVIIALIPIILYSGVWIINFDDKLMDRIDATQVNAKNRTSKINHNFKVISRHEPNMELIEIE